MTAITRERGAWLSTDIRNIFPSAWRTFLWRLLVHIGVPDTVATAIMNLHERNWHSIVHGGARHEVFVCAGRACDGVPLVGGAVRLNLRLIR